MHILEIEYADGTTETVHTNIGDKLQYSKTARAKGWVSMAEDALLYLYFIAWHALRRTKNGDYVTWEVFSNADTTNVVDIGFALLDEDVEETADTALGKDGNPLMLAT